MLLKNLLLFWRVALRHRVALVAPHVALADDPLDIDRDRSEIPAHLEPAVTVGSSAPPNA